MDRNSVPILFLIFNRPEKTRKVFDTIRNQKPRLLFIAADGPRHDKLGENELCEKTREIVANIDWDCEVKKLFRDHNLGCKIAISSAVNWFFDQVEEGIILEDDCLPDPTFFRFCEELLEKYRFDYQVMSISGSNLLETPWKIEIQSYSWGHGGIWGWATWKRAWDLYDIDMKGWENKVIKNTIKNAIGTDEWFNFYYSMFESSYNRSLDTWDVQWFYSILINDGLAINPAVNLVKNIGYGDGTHTNSEDLYMAKIPLCSLWFPLIHPLKKLKDISYLKKVYDEMNKQSTIKISFLKKVLRFLRRKFSLSL
jgi:hypothetical protein